MGRFRGLCGATAAVAMVAAATTACVVPPPPNPGPITPGDPGPADVRFTIRSDQDVRAISPLIYGTNSTRDLATNRQSAIRLGGNRWTAYNWENNASNAGSDWCYQNDGYLSSSNTPGAAITPTMDQARTAGATLVVTVPIVDYVAADKLGGCDVRNTPNYLQVRMRQNRHTKSGSLSLTPDASDGAVYQDEFVNWVRSSANGVRVVFSLDNEPDLWSSTHPEVHPNPVTYSELATRNIDFARAVKRVWPAAKVSGPVNYGFYGFETLQGAPDAGSHGNFLDWWLQQMRAAEVANGVRLIDYLDLHWYPEARGGGIRITGTDTGAAVVAARVQAPRSLWDPTYVEDSWITRDYGYGAIRLIPRMRDRIAVHYPGTALAFTEWNFGGGNHISGAVASADVLGIFGREGVALANFWELNGNESFAYAAFRAYRNYDGAGSTFGDTSIGAQSSDVPTATVYASQHSADPNKVVLVVINKATTTKMAGITVAHPQRFTRAKVWTITAGGGANLVPAADLAAVDVNAFRYTMPALSVSVIVPQP